MSQARDAEAHGLSTSSVPSLPPPFPSEHLADPLLARFLARSKGPGYFSNAGMSVPEPVASSHTRSYSHAGAPGYPPAQPHRQP